MTVTGTNTYQNHDFHRQHSEHQERLERAPCVCPL